MASAKPGAVQRSPSTKVLNVFASETVIDRALSLVDTLIKSLEVISFAVDVAHGETFIEAPNTGVRLPFVLREVFKRVKHVLTEEEIAKQRDVVLAYRTGRGADYPHFVAPDYDHNPTGKLLLEIGKWPQKTWRDTEKTTLEQRVPQIVLGIAALADDTHRQAVEQADKEERYRRAVERYKNLTERRASEHEQLKSLEGEAALWQRALQIRAYADAVESRAIADGAMDEQLQEWLAWARAKADGLDPLVLVCDPILDAPEPQEPRRW